MTNLRRHAKGKDCKIRLIGVCNFDPETTSLAHLRQAGITGVGQKAPDALGSYACSACAAATENGYTKNIEHKLAFYQGMARTQYEWIQEGLITW